MGAGADGAPRMPSTPCRVNWRQLRELTQTDTDMEVHFYDLTNSPDEVHSMSNAQRCATIQAHSWGDAWIQSVQAYTKGLDAATKEVLRDYKFRGDRIMNLWLRGDTDTALALMRESDTFQFRRVAMELLEKRVSFMETFFVELPMMKDYRGQMVFDRHHVARNLNNDMKAKMTDDFLLTVVAEAARLMAKAIRNAPPLANDVLLFRGVKTDMFDKGTAFVARGFVSATNSGVVASEFARNGGFVLRIHVPRGTRCLPLVLGGAFYDELETVLAPGSVLHQTACRHVSTPIRSTAAGGTENYIGTLCDVQLGQYAAGVKRKHGSGTPTKVQPS